MALIDRRRAQQQICEQRAIGIGPIIRGVATALVVLAVLGPTGAQAVPAYIGFEQTFGYKADQTPKGFTIQLIASSAPANVLWPGDDASFTFQIINNADQPLKAVGHFEVIQIATRTDLDDVFAQIIMKVKDIANVPANLDIPAKGFVNRVVEAPIPATFGAYAIVFSIDGMGRQLAATCVRTPAATPGKVQNPTYALDVQRAEVAVLFKRIGVKGTRMESGPGVFVGDPRYAEDKARMAKLMQAMSDNDITVMLTVATGGDQGRMPLGQIRSLLNEKDEGKMGYPGDFTALPKYDEEFQKWCQDVTETFGWPKGPVNAIELWNEPWEGTSISGWGADMLRYRELYTHMAKGIEAGRAKGAQVLIGGTCSSMNTEDKLFPDGNYEPFLKWLDFTSIHYQPMSAEPALVKAYRNRKSSNGPVQVWDTESWIANSEDRVAAVIASMRAQGQQRTAGVLHDATRSVDDFDVRQPNGAAPQRVTIVQALPPAAAIAATQQYIGQRQFKEILFQNGLPWVFVFDGLKVPDDGSVVVVGDLGGVYERDLLRFRTVLGLKSREQGKGPRAQLAVLPPDATEETRKALLGKIKSAEVLDDASITIADPERHFFSYDFYGNAMASQNDKLTVPLNGLGYFLRTDGTPGSFAKLLDAVKDGRIEGYEPVEIVARDLLGRVTQKPSLRLTLTNILNRPVSGKMEVKLGNLQLAEASSTLKLAAHETKELVMQVTGGADTADNTYPLTVVFDAGADGKATHEEPIHGNVITRKTIAVDGNLDDWKDVLPQPIRSSPGSGKNLTEKAWLPFAKFEDVGGQGVASGFLAYDDQNFYFAAKIADATPYEGNIRFGTRDEDAEFYPETSYRLEENSKTHEMERKETLHWPQGVRRYSYRRDPAIPSGDSTDNVQIGFNVLPGEQSDWIETAPGTMPRFMIYKTTDYEYALNPVAEKYGGGTELWRLAAPGVPRKHFYPRQPKAPKDGGPVAGGKLAMRRDGNTRIVECAIPWSEIPDVKKRLDSGEPIKFTFRVNDNKGPSYELNTDRSCSKVCNYALHNFWATSWATETEFTFEK